MVDRLPEASTGIKASWLAELTDIIPCPERIGQYGDTIKKHSLARQQISVHHQAISLLFNGEDPSKVASGLLAEISRSLSMAHGNAADLSQIVPTVISEIEDASTGAGGSTGLSSPFHSLNQIIGGFRPAELVILAARPSMGKTALALNLARDVAVSGNQVLFFSLEMSREALVQRLIADVANISFSAMRNGELSQGDLATIRKLKSELEKLPITIDDRSSLNISQIEARTAQISAKRDISMIVLDYLQLCRAKAESRFHEVGEVSGFLKGLAKKYHVPVVALSQLSRDIEKRRGADAAPKLSDLRESGSIEQDADLVMFIHGKKEGTARSLVVAKQRNGPLGSIDLNFIGWHQRFEEIKKQ